MVEDRLTDGVRIAQLLASEITGDAERLGSLRVIDPDPDVEPTADGELAYRIGFVPDPRPRAEGVSAGRSESVSDPDPRSVVDVFVQPDRARVEFHIEPDTAAEAAREAGLRVRPKAVRPPRTLVFLEDGAQVKWILPALEAVADALAE